MRWTLTQIITQLKLFSVFAYSRAKHQILSVTVDISSQTKSSMDTCFTIVEFGILMPLGGNSKCDIKNSIYRSNISLYKKQNSHQTDHFWLFGFLFLSLIVTPAIPPSPKSGIPPSCPIKIRGSNKQRRIFFYSIRTIPTRNALASRVELTVQCPQVKDT